MMFKLKKSATKLFSVAVSAALLMSLIASVQVLLSPKHVSAACAAVNAPYGTVSDDTANNKPFRFTPTQSGTYRLSVRIKSADIANNSFTLDVGDANCGIKVGGTGLTANTWKWVDYKDGSETSKINLALTANTTYVLKAYGTQPGVMIDRLLFMSDTACPVSGTGDNCYTPPDTIAPTVSLSSPASGSTVKGTTTVSATANDDQQVSKVDFYYGTTNRTIMGSDTSSPYSYAWNTAGVPDGTYTLTAVATDSSGNTTTSSAISVTVQNAAPPPPAPDTTKPSTPANLTATLATGTTSPQANLSWGASTDNVGVTGYEVYKGGTLLKTVTTNATTDAGLTIGQTYSYYVIAKDAAGNKSVQSNTASVTVPDTVLPTVSLTSPADGGQVSGTVSVAATAADNIAVTKVQFLVDGQLQAGADTSAPYTFSWNTASLPNGSHTISAESLDAAGNKSLRDTATVTVQNGDTTPPSAPGNFKAVASAYNKVDLTWTAATDAGGIKDYLLVKNGVWVGLMGASTTSYTDNDVTASTAYSYELIAMDNSDNLNSATTTVTTPAAPTVDTQAPTAPANLTAVVSPGSTTQINLSWGASTDNVGVKSYQVFRNGANVATVTTTSFGDVGLAADTTYEYTVKALDAAGNVSAASNAVTAKTLSSTNPNLAFGKTTKASSIEANSYLAANAVDGSGSTRWASFLKADGSGGSDPEWIYVDLGSTYTVSGAKLNWEDAYGKAYQVQVSDDATTWKTIYSTTTGDGGTDDLSGLSGSGRYVRMYGTARGTKWGYSLYEMEIYGRSATTPPPSPITTGTITGTVSDSNSGTPLGSVYVSVYYNGSRHTVKTPGTTGIYTLQDVPAGSYNVRYARTRYNTKYVTSDVVAGGTLVQNVKMVRK